MTSPEDDHNLEEALRRALAEAASGVEPGSDGLDKIRTRIAGRPPRPWLRSVLFGVVERVTNWTWRGHWAWPGRLPRLAEVRWPHPRRSGFPGPGTGWLRVAAVLGGAAVIAGITLGVQPFRNAILQPGGALSGGGPQQGTAGTDGHGAVAASADTPSASVAGGPGGAGGSPGAVKPTASPRPDPAARCGSGTSPAVAGARPSLTQVPASPSATGVPAAAVPTAAVPTAATPTAARSATVTPKTPADTDTPLTCPVTARARSATPTPTPAPTTPTPTPAGGDSAPASAPATVSPTLASSTPASSPTPTADPSQTAEPSATGDRWPGPAAAPSRSWPSRRPHGVGGRSR